MNKLIYNTINNEGVLKSSGPHRILQTDNLQSTNFAQSHKNFPPVKTKNVVIKEEITCLKKKVF